MASNSLSIEQRIAKLGAPRGLRVLLASIAGVTPNAVTEWAAGRLVAHRHRAAAALDAALADVEYAHSYIQFVADNDGVPPALTPDNVRALVAIRTDSERMTQTA